MHARQWLLLYAYLVPGPRHRGRVLAGVAAPPLSEISAYRFNDVNLQSSPCLDHLALERFTRSYDVHGSTEPTRLQQRLLRKVYGTEWNFLSQALRFVPWPCRTKFAQAIYHVIVRDVLRHTKHIQRAVYSPYAVWVHKCCAGNFGHDHCDFWGPLSTLILSTSRIVVSDACNVSRGTHRCK